MADTFSHVDFSDLNSVNMEVVNSISSGTVLPAEFYLRAVEGLSASVPDGTTSLFGSAEYGDDSVKELLGNLSLDGPGEYSHIQVTDVGAFLANGQTVSALQYSIDSGVTINGYTDIVDALNAASTDSLWGLASEKYASNASVSGHVFAYVTDGASPSRIFGEIELQALLDNPNVQSVNGINVEDLRKLPNIGDAFSVVQQNALSAMTFLVGDAYTKGLLGSENVLRGYFNDLGIDPDSSDYFRMAVEQVEYEAVHGPGGLNFASTARIYQILDVAGTAGDIAGIAITASKTYALYSEGRTDEALALMESELVAYLGGAAGGYSGGVIALAILGLLVPEPSTTAAGATVIIGAIAGGLVGEELAEGLYNELKAKMASGAPLSEDDFFEMVTQAAGNCFAAGTPVRLWGEHEEAKPIEEVAPGDVVMSYDGQGRLVGRPVRRVFRNEARHLLDVHGLKVTPGHVTLCGDGPFAGRHVPIIDILLSDGALVREDGSLVRMSINKPAGSAEDQFVRVRYAESSSDLEKGILKDGQMRAGTLLFDREGAPVSVLDCIRAQRLSFDPETGLVRNGDEAPQPLSWFGPLPRPEDYILKRSRETLEGILVSGEWEGTPSALIEGRLRQTAARYH